MRKTANSRVSSRSSRWRDPWKRLSRLLLRSRNLEVKNYCIDFSDPGLPFCFIFIRVCTAEFGGFSPEELDSTFAKAVASGVVFPNALESDDFKCVPTLLKNTASTCEC
jgi:hypothetical protein